ncbi:MAG: MoaD/ThiS family protein [Aquificaceae bacterium]|nr:MoaD/ThiS family protein [Aquificaceae bacterium]MCX8164850.1 MoaD/ThiS family protein [Aquificaceae bacterium]
MRLLYFAIIKERLKKNEEDVDFRGTVAELRAFLMEKYPDIKDLLKVTRFAINEVYADEEEYLKGDERVAVIPPVSGG